MSCTPTDAEFTLDKTLHHGRPTGDRLPKELRCYELLESLGIDFARADHTHADTISQCHVVETLLGCAICKNLLLTNRQGTQFYLLLIDGDLVFKTKYLSAQLGCARLSFAPGEMMQELLDITPGSLSVLGLMNDKENRVQLVIDKPVSVKPQFACHPCINTSTVSFPTQALLETLLPAMQHAPIFVELPQDEP